MKISVEIISLEMASHQHAKQSAKFKAQNGSTLSKKFEYSFKKPYSVAMLKEENPRGPCGNLSIIEISGKEAVEKCELVVK